MAESDPKRFAAHGRPAGERDLDSEEDPLVELARIVSEDGSFYGARKSAARRDSQPPARAEPTAADLEAELLQELEASLNGPPGTAPNLGTARRGPSPGFVPRQTEDRQQAAPAPPDPPTPAQYGGSFAERESQDLLRAIEAQLGDFERRAQERAPAPQAPKTDWQDSSPVAEDSWEMPYPDEDLPQPDPDPDPDPGSWEPSAPPADVRPADYEDETSPAEDFGEADHALADEELEPSPAPWTRQDDPLGWNEPQVTAADWTRDATRAWEAEFAKSSDQQDRVEPLPERDAWSGFEPGPDQPAMDWLTPSAEEGDKLRGTIAPLDSRETKDVAGKSQARNQPASLETRFSDPSLNADWQGAALSRAAPPPPDEDDDPIPAAVTPIKRKQQAEAKPPGRARSGRRLTTVLSLLGVVVLGGAVAFYMRSFDGEVTGPPPVIAAEEGPVKMVPEAQASGETEDVPGAAVYDRVAGTNAAAEETMVSGAEEPREVARIVLPATQAGNGETLTRSVGADAEANLPKKVRTVVVKADGSVVETVEDAPVEAAATPAPVAEERPDPDPIQPTPVDTTPLDGNGEVQPGVAVATAPASAPAPQAAAPQPAPAATQAPVTPAPAAVVPQQVARTDPPVDLLAGAPRAASGDGFHVQLSSQRSEAQALDAFQGLKARYPSLLGSATPSVQRADLAEKGIYYRLRVGPMASREEAVSMCEQLKAAGGSCFVAR